MAELNIVQCAFHSVQLLFVYPLQQVLGLVVFPLAIVFPLVDVFPLVVLFPFGCCVSLGHCVSLGCCLALVLPWLLP